MHLSATLELYYLVNEIVGSSEYLCSAGGKFCNHSTEFLVCVGNLCTGRPPTGVMIPDAV